ncbi:MAG: substrate-binding domain-containing protein [Spirochaetota bacterium]
MKPRFPFRAALLSMACTVVLFAFGCSREEPRENDQIRIGFSVDSLVVERWIRNRDGFISAGRELGAEILYRNALESEEQQARDIISLHEEGIDVLVVIPFDANALTDAVNRVVADGVPVISYDRLMLGSNVSAYISFDNVEVGRLMAEGVISRVQSGNLVIINGGARDHNSAMLNEGFYDVLAPLIADGSISVVEEYNPSDWLPELFVSEFEALIESGVKIDGVIAANDQFADAAITVLARQRLAGDVIVVGQDADLLAVQRLVRGTQHRTIYKPVAQLSRRAAELAVSLARGQEVKTDIVIDNRARLVPYVAIDPIAVEADNIEATVIADQFHRRENVFSSPLDNE